MPPLRRIVVAAFVLLVLFIIGTHYFFEARRIAQLKAAVEEREALLRQKQESVRDYREKVVFYSSQEGIEHMAREHYNLVFPNERVILIRSDDAGPGGVP
ncbi:MAG: septum formation initiator family protein [Fretibacterium sp.]|uniref:FtsB family cell division protein n=1 Tax=Fretibacterium sp. OH1220_COT-178 TaxID=2491047 RepID=UPI000F5F5808|nr:septum formation initiator family protein [Fretibacterium sp. OH1220_COT-178]MDO4785733.1 septum formation initiator family protein [Fretibacterium sp.]RRD64869.1 septum formation initiator [Fretibacterium sp. OH1220_COT-178]